MGRHGVVCVKIGWAHRQFGDIEEAGRYLNEVLALKRFELVALARLAEIRAILGHYNEATVYFERLVYVDCAETIALHLRRVLAPA